MKATALMRQLEEFARLEREKLELVDPFPKEEGRERWAWYKRQERRYYAKTGYVTFTVLASPSLYKKLEGWLQEYVPNGCNHPPRGAELTKFLEDLELTD